MSNMNLGQTDYGAPSIYDKTLKNNLNNRRVEQL